MIGPLLIRSRVLLYLRQGLAPWRTIGPDMRSYCGASLMPGASVRPYHNASAAWRTAASYSLFIFHSSFFILHFSIFNLRIQIPLLVLTSAICAAQPSVTGRVFDAVTGEALPAATIQIEGTSKGTTSNLDGAFEIPIERFPAALLIRYIGYETARLDLTVSSLGPFEVAMKSASFQLAPLEVTDEDPAVSIMRKVIETKSRWKETVPAFRSEARSRFMLYRTDDLVSVEETISDQFWKDGRGTAEFVQAFRRRPTGPKFRFAATQIAVNLYDDDIPVRDFLLPGPTHPDALDIYTFRIGDRRSLDGQTVYDIFVSPRTTLTTGFVGRVSVLDSAYVIVSALLRPSRFAIQSPPVTDWGIQFEQQFGQLLGDVWVPLDLSVTGHVTFGRTGVSYPKATFTQTSRISNHVPVSDVPDSLFTGDRRTMDTLARERSYLFEVTAGMVPLTAIEARKIEQLNPRLTLNRAFIPSGLLRQYGGVRLDEPDADQPATRDRLLELVKMADLRYDRVDGPFLGIRPIRRFKSGVASLRAGYSTERRVFQGGLGGSFSLPGTSAMTPFIAADVNSGTRTIASSDVYSRMLNTVPTYVGALDYFDYFDSRSAEASIGLRFPKLASTLSATAFIDRQTSLPQTIEGNGWLLGEHRSNPDIPEVTHRGFRGEISIGAPRKPRIVASKPSFGVSWTVVPASGMRPGFQTGMAWASGVWPTFYRRRPWPQSVRARLVGGLGSDATPYTFSGILDTSLGVFSPFATFKTRRGTPYNGTKYAAGFIEYDLSTIPFEWLGLGALQTGVIFHGAAGIAQRPGEINSNLPTTDARFEAGLSLTNMLGFPLRLDFTCQLQSRGCFAGIGAYRVIK